MSDSPNGFLVGDLISFGDPPRFVSKGFYFEAPSLFNASDAVLTNWHLTMRTFLKRITGNLHAQIFHSTDCDYEFPLERYRAITEQAQGPQVCLETRKALYYRYKQRQETRNLRREVLRVYLSKPVESEPPLGLSRREQVKHWERVFQEAEAFFELQLAMLQSVFAQTGARITAMTADDHATHYFQYLQPHLRQHVEKVSQRWKPELSLQENFFNTGLRGGETNRVPFGFTRDGHYYNVFTMKRLPDDTIPGKFEYLTRLRMLDYAVVTNLYPMDVEVAKRRQIRDLKALKGAKSNDEEVDIQINLKKSRIDNLSSGEVSPYLMDYGVIVWAEDLATLKAKSEVIKNAIDSMTGAKYFEPSLDSTARKLFFQLMPGAIHGAYRAHALYTEDVNVADLLPFSSTNTLSLDKADAIYDGDNGHLVGLRLFVGKTPQHFLIIGSSGSGKSMFVNDLLLQTAHMFGLTIIIGEGNDYVNYCKKVGTKPRYIHPDANVCMNPFDTRGLPLTDSHISVCAALFTLMAGAPKDPDKYALRRAIIVEYMHSYAQDTADDYLRSHPHAMVELGKEALTILALFPTLEMEDPNFMDGFLHLVNLKKSDPVQVEALFAQIPEKKAIAFAQEHGGSIHVRNLVFSRLKAEEYPQLTPFADFFRTRHNPHHDEVEVKTIATLLRSWTKHGGSYGCLFDGVTNIPFSDSDQYYELGKLGEGDTILKGIVGFLLTNQVRSEILRRPLNELKRVLFEEVARFLAVPGGEKIVKEFYAQMRKYKVVVGSIVQQYSQFRYTNESIKEILIGNSKLRIIFKQDSKEDLEHLGEQLRLPQSAIETIAGYPMPEFFENNPFDAHSSFLVVQMTVQRPLIGTARYYGNR